MDVIRHGEGWVKRHTLKRMVCQCGCIFDYAECDIITKHQSNGSYDVVRCPECYREYTREDMEREKVTGWQKFLSNRSLWRGMSEKKFRTAESNMYCKGIYIRKSGKGKMQLFLKKLAKRFGN